MAKPVTFPFPIRDPLPPNSAFGKRPLYGDFHSGVDFNSTTGAYLNTPIIAAGPGRVVESYNGNVAGQSNWAKLRGTMVRIDHGGGWWTRYHMLVPNSNIKLGTVVNTGDVIGRVGSSGSSTTGPHLHFELWYNGVAINPVGQLTYNPASFAGGGATPIEDDMTPEQDQMLRNVYSAIFLGGPSMSDGGRSIEDSLANIVKGIDAVKADTASTRTTVQQKVQRGDQQITQIQEIADSKTMLERIEPKVNELFADSRVTVPPAEVEAFELDYDKLATLIVEKLPQSDAASKQDVLDALKSVSFVAS